MQSLSAVIDYALPFLAAIGALVAVHELGHFWAARALGIAVEGFSLGMGPELAGWTDRRGCRWSLRLLPVGGYVRFRGDENAASANAGAADHAGLPEAERARLYALRPPGHRAFVLLAGPLANLLFGVLVVVLLYGTYGRQHTPPLLTAVAADGPAAAAGFRAGDLVLRVDGAPVERFEDLQAAVSQKADREVRIAVRRADGSERTLAVVPKGVTVSRMGSELRIGLIGVQAEGRVIERLPPGRAVVVGAQDAWRITTATVVGLVQTLSGARSIAEVGGPVRIVQMTGGAYKASFAGFVFLVALLSFSLGVFNLAPVPVLDGGHLVICAYEAVARRPASPKALEYAYKGGAACLLLLIVVVSWNDVASVYRQIRSDRAAEQRPPG